jgi:ABC-type glycerol-3-phosphate transport system permease component
MPRDIRKARPGLFFTGLVAATVFAFPIWFMVTSAFKEETEIQAIPIHW